MSKEKQLINGISTPTPPIQLNGSIIMEYAGTIHGYREVVTRMPGHWHRYTYADMLTRVRKGANVLDSLGVKPGEIVGVWAYSTYRAFEIVYALMGKGVTFHLTNYAVPPQDITYILNHLIDHAPYNVVFVEDNLVPTFDKIYSQLKTKPLKKMVIFGDNEKKAETSFKNVEYYEDLLSKAKSTYDWPQVDETSAALLMTTSATTGRPKPFLHSHRNCWFQSMGQAVTCGLGPMDNILVLPPFTHGGWFYWNTATMLGAKMILPGPMATAEDFAACLIDEKATFVGAVPVQLTMIMNVIRQRQAKGEKIDLTGTKVLYAGMKPTESLVRAYMDLGANCMQAYAYSEGCGPEVIANVPRPLNKDMSFDERVSFIRNVCGYPAIGVWTRIVDDNGNVLPWDGKSVGSVQTKFAFGVREYWESPEATEKGFTEDHYLKAADLAQISEWCNMTLYDRAMDAIKSGGEWISSPFLEGEICEFTPVAEACVVGIKHPQWDERPIALIALKPEYKGKATEEDIRNFLLKKVDDGKIRKWAIPDKLIIVDAIPKNAVMKFDKRAVRQQYADIFSEATGQKE